VHAAKFFESSDEEMAPNRKKLINLPNIPKLDDGKYHSITTVYKNNKILNTICFTFN